ncbi:MAG: EAL domain-containing protein [Xanthomonadales bacterium]|nr:EAL domain-containing protein [Xanthomonadales bacterium]
MGSYRILIIDQSPEAAGEINLLLNNSGISVRVLYASTQYDLDAIGSDKSPDIIIVQNPDDSDLSLSAVKIFCQKHPNASYFIRRSTSEVEFMKQAFDAGFTGFLDINNPEMTSAVLKRELKNRQASSELQQHQKVLADIEDRYKLLLESSRAPVAYVHEGFHIYANPAYLELFGFSSFDDLEGESVLGLLRLDEEEGDFRKLLKLIHKGELPDHEVKAISNHDQRQIDLEFLPARFKGEHCIQLWVHERQSDPEVLAELEHLRNHDALTGLANRESFLEALENVGDGKQENQVYSVLLIEADQIDTIARELGARGTDHLMREMAGILTDECEPSTVCSRYQDSVFACLVQAENKQEIETTTQKILQRCRDSVFDLGNHSITATCSIGLAYIGNMQVNADELLQQSTAALNDAHEDGGDRVSRYRPKLTAVDGTDDEEHWGERLRYAINHSHENLLIIQQAIVDVADSDQDLYIEAFTYLKEDKEEIDPSVYMPKAEDHQLAADIDRAILPQILGMIAHPESATEVSTYFYSLSRSSVEDVNFPGWLRQQFESTGADSSRLVLQVSGLDVARNLKPVQRLMQALSGLDCPLSISHFNGEQGVMSALKHLPVAFIKLDAEITRQLGSNPKISEQIQVIVSHAKANNTQVIAGEVASATELSTIWSTGIELVQGDYLKQKTRVAAQ